ncbi:MAG: efflux RND transporter permease subunit [Chitinispirillales bacterium]|jgi:hypothetical protein|nr:efflux RND transporter permease subunit [Chitinispirillales bacterium]
MTDRDDDYDEDDEDEEEQPDKAAAMVLWTKRLAFFLGVCAFVVMFLLSYDFESYLDAKMLVIAMIKGLCAALLFWMAGLIIGNIFLKGLVTDIPVDQNHLIDGGILQRIYLYQQRLNYDMDGNIIQIDPRNDTIVKTKSARIKKNED